MPIYELIRREVRVALSPRAQPVWFRVVKWTLIIVLGLLYWRRPMFWWLLLGAFLAGLGVHLFYRRQTRCWTQPWGGWDDLEHR